MPLFVIFVEKYLISLQNLIQIILLLYIFVISSWLKQMRYTCAMMERFIEVTIFRCNLQFVLFNKMQHQMLNQKTLNQLVNHHFTTQNELGANHKKWLNTFFSNLSRWYIPLSSSASFNVHTKNLEVLTEFFRSQAFVQEGSLEAT